MNQIARIFARIIFTLGTVCATVVVTANDDMLKAGHNWQTNVGHGQFVNISSDDRLSAAQGVERFKLNNKNLIALTHGYTNINASILDYNGVFKKSILLDKSIPSELIADVTASPDALWWTGHRSRKIYRTSLDLSSVKTVELPENIYSLVGITTVPELEAVIFVHREKPLIGFLKTDLSEDVKFYPLQKSLEDPYDIKYNKGLIFLVDRSAGQILTFDINSFSNGRPITTKVFAQNLSRPQHLDIFEDYLYVIETGANQISRFSLTEKKRTIFMLNDKKIYRGLTVLSKKLIAITGFLDVENLTESRTGVSFFELSNP